MSVSGRKISKVVALAKELLPGIRQAQERAISEWNRAEREGLKEGYVPAYCIHGVSMWNDNAVCGTCELYGFNWLPNPLEVALSEARCRHRELVRRVEAVAATAGAGAPIGLVAALSSWAREALEG